MDSSGVNALKEYITGTNRARFSSFVSKNKKRIPEWSIRINATSAHGLHDAWVQQYDTVHMKKNAIDTFHEEAISTLTTAARPTAREVRQLIDPVALNKESTQDTIDSRHAAEDDADLHLDSSSEELSPTSDSSPPSQLSLQLRAPGRDRFQVDNVDISGKFYQLQQYVFDFVISNNLTLESDVHLILSLNSILLLQNNNRLHKAMVPFFGNKLYTRIREHNLDSWNSTSKFPGDVLLKTIEIVQSVYEKTTDRIGASVSILNLASTMDDKINKRLIVSASQLLQSLPMDPTNTLLMIEYKISIKWMTVLARIRNVNHCPFFLIPGFTEARINHS
ncbi:hypothetical protein EC973_004311 [Apophysomyces ossiformis]|uniref:Uncharacterized protein n=1 Tax=Apophysomyces ossiformis TaxID=679940 RepID=A0A8H7BKN7_9FUNG|nr:hypothetical protein EC973_004311 [Apophysomyces ossiformis]